VLDAAVEDAVDGHHRCVALGQRRDHAGLGGGCRGLLGQALFELVDHLLLVLERLALLHQLFLQHLDVGCGKGRGHEGHCQGSGQRGQAQSLCRLRGCPPQAIVSNVNRRFHLQVSSQKANRGPSAPGVERQAFDSVVEGGRRAGLRPSAPLA
jgi:hypothetical protein